MPDIFQGVAAPLPIANVDTDVIMPKRFLITITREGLADGTFADLRFDETGNRQDSFVLNRSPWNTASILIVGDNFGCGSSREHAVWGLRQLGISACIGTGFAGIFYNNASKNGLALPIVSAKDRDTLLQLTSSDQPVNLTINLQTRTIAAEGLSLSFEMDHATRSRLIHGRDDTLDTLTHADAIAAYEVNLDDLMRVNVIK